MQQIETPPLKWAGGKRWLVPHIEPIWQAYLKQKPSKTARLVEPFCGGLAVTLALQPHQAILNDVNPHLINFYHQLKVGLVAQPDLFVNQKEVYYHNRERFNHLIREGQSQTQEAALLFYYLNRTGFNGLCRFNSKGFFNVPFGQHRKINYFLDFLPYQPVFKKWVWCQGDFEQLALQEDDFIYADPPYDEAFSNYAGLEFEWSDQIRLVEWLSDHPGVVVLSNHATARVIKLYQSAGFQLSFLDAPRNISRNGCREKVQEVLALKGF